MPPSRPVQRCYTCKECVQNHPNSTLIESHFFPIHQKRVQDEYARYGESTAPLPRLPAYRDGSTNLTVSFSFTDGPLNAPADQNCTQNGYILRSKPIAPSPAQLPTLADNLMNLTADFSDTPSPTVTSPSAIASSPPPSLLHSLASSKSPTDDSLSSSTSLDDLAGRLFALTLTDNGASTVDSANKLWNSHADFQVNGPSQSLISSPPAPVPMVEVAASLTCLHQSTSSDTKSLNSHLPNNHTLGIPLSAHSAMPASTVSGS